MDANTSNMDRANFEVPRSQMEKWIACIRTPLTQTAGIVVNPSPHPMHQLASNPGNNKTVNWRQSLFEP